MPKPFYVEVAIEESSFGSVMRKLDSMDGVISINWDADRDRGAKPKRYANGGDDEPRKPSAPRPVYETTGNEAMLDMLYKSKTPMSSRQLGDAFAAAGRARASIASVLDKLKKAGDIQNTFEGYALTKKARDRLRKRK